MTVKILRAILIILILVVIGLYIYEIAVLQKDPMENLFRAVIVAAGCAAGIARLSGKGRRRSLDYYEAMYRKDIGNAFSGAFLDRKKLLCAIRLYNEGNFRKSAKYLAQLKPQCKESADFYAVGMFLALIYTDLRLYDQAVMMYHQLIGMELASSTIYGNLGYVYSKLGEDEKTLSCYTHALELDPKNAFPQYNIAKFYFDKRDFENAIVEAEKALAIDSKMRHALTLLTIIYTLENNKELAEKYYHMAVLSGENPDDMKSTVEFFKKSFSEEAEGEEGES